MARSLKPEDVKRAAIYIRVSTQHQIDKASLPVQREELINYARYALGIESYEVFEDAGYSAKNTDRPDYQQMMARIRTGEFSHLLVWKIDRISRNLLDFSNMYAELKKLGVTFVSKNEQFDTSNAMGEAMLKIILVFAELERNMTSERVSMVMVSRANDGVWNGGRVPFGYDYDKSTATFSINSAESKVVLMIYDMFEKAHSLTSVARDINGMGISQRTGKPWSPVTVRSILINPFYAGTYRYNYRDESGTGNSRYKSEDEWIFVEDHHPALVTAERQAAIIVDLASRRRSEDIKSKNSQKNIHIFAGLLTCGCCGSNMVASRDRVRATGLQYSMYMCSRRRRFNDCDNKYITDKALGEFALNFISNVIRASNSFGKSTSKAVLEKKLLRGDALSEVDHLGDEGLTELYNHLRSGYDPNPFSGGEAMEADRDETKPERDLLLSEKRRLERALNRLKALYLYSDDGMSEKDFILEQKSLQDKLEQTDDRIAELDAKAAKLTNMSDDEFFAKASYFLLSQELQDKRHIEFDKIIVSLDQSILREFIKNVTTNFCIRNGHVISILFRNGIEIKFFYKAAIDAESPET